MIYRFMVAALKTARWRGRTIIGRRCPPNSRPCVGYGWPADRPPEPIAEHRCWASSNAVSRAGAQPQKEIPMRIPALTILAIVMASAAPPARAQTYDPNYPVCLQIYQSFKDYYFECAYTSLAQCNMSASGRAAQCIVNPYYAGPKTKGRRYRRVY